MHYDRSRFYYDRSRYIMTGRDLIMKGQDFRDDRSRSSCWKVEFFMITGPDLHDDRSRLFFHDDNSRFLS